MFSLLWIPATIVAAALQVGRNAMQRGMMSSSGPWGATLVRFLFGLPFGLLFAAGALVMVPAAAPNWSAAFWISACAGATSQVLATSLLLLSMQRAGFAVGTALQQSSLPFAAITGLLIFQEQVSVISWIGVGIATLGLTILSWPAPDNRRASIAGAIFGLASGLLFGFGLNAFRHAALALENDHPVFAALLLVPIVQAMQSVALLLYLRIRDPQALREVARRWRTSLWAGMYGGLASIGWFVALSLAPAAAVRALGTIETPIAAVAGHRLFRERLRLHQIVAGFTVIAGVVMAALY